MTTARICAACGVQFAPAPSRPERCPICEDSRVFGREIAEGQRWTSLDQLRAGYRNRLQPLAPDLVSIRVEPTLSVGHHCLLARGKEMNVLWDCLSLIDGATVEAINALGGLHAIAVSHPHFYGSMVEWSRAFDNVPIYVHAADREWVQRLDPAIAFWKGDSQPLGKEFTIVRCGGHFDGSSVLHWSPPGRAACLLTGDTIDVQEDCQSVEFTYSFPTQIPLGESAVRGVLEAIEPFDFELLWGCWRDRLIRSDAKHVIDRSAQRYLGSHGRES